MIREERGSWKYHKPLPYSLVLLKPEDLRKMHAEMVNVLLPYSLVLLKQISNFNGRSRDGSIRLPYSLVLLKQ